MRMTTFNQQPTRLPAVVSCFAQGIDRLVAKGWSLSGRTTG